MKKIRIEFEVSNKSAKDLRKNGIGGLTLVHAYYKEYNNIVFPADTNSRFYINGHKFRNPKIEMEEDK